jgi:pimeloyl-ACP methyl ester carboxylesterase
MNQLAIGAARRETFDAGGQKIAALQVGPAAGPPVLLVPGYTGSKEDLGAILEPLAAAGLLVTAMDLPGQFESPGLARAADYTPDTLARSVLDVAQALGAPVRLLGHSFGGLVSRAAVIADPARFASLVLLSSGPADLEGVRRVTMDGLEPVLAASGLPGVYAAMQATALGDPGFVAPPDDLAEFLERRFLGGSPDMLKGMADALRHEPDRVAELAATGIRVLVAHGVDDDAWPADAQADMADRLHARYVVIPDAAHSAAAENPAALVDVLLEFWEA